MEGKTIYIIGSGAIGKALSVFLQQEGKQVVLVRGSVDNMPPTENLITVTNQDGRKFQQKITTVTLNGLERVNGIVLITAKSFANAELASKLKDKKGNFSIVLLQNGLNIERPFTTLRNVYRCVLFATSQVISENNIAYKVVDASPIGYINGENGNTDSIVDEINTPYFSFKSVVNISKYVWDKAIINCAFNSICPLLETDNGIFRRNIEANKLAKIIIEECAALAGQYNIKVDAKEIEEKLLLISKRSDGQLISTYEDIRNKRKTEIESLNLEIARLADEKGTPGLVKNVRLLGEMIRLKSEIQMI